MLLVTVGGLLAIYLADGTNARHNQWASATWLVRSQDKCPRLTWLNTNAICIGHSHSWSKKGERDDCHRYSYPELRNVDCYAK